MKPNLLNGQLPFSVLHFFQGGVEGSSPYAAVLDTAGDLFGIAINGGNTACKSGCGTIFSLQSVASGAWPFTLLYSFTGGNDGSYPNSLIEDTAGNLYGTASGGSGGGGVVFELPAALK